MEKEEVEGSTNGDNAGRTIRDVDYTVEVWGDLPESSTERQKRHETSLVQVIEKRPLTSDGRPAWVLIAKYNDNGASTAAAAVLRRRHGPPEARGWEFAVRKIAPGKKGLFAKYDPDGIVKGAFEKHEKALAEKNAELKERAATKKSAKSSK